MYSSVIFKTIVYMFKAELDVWKHTLEDLGYCGKSLYLFIYTFQFSVPLSSSLPFQRGHSLV